MPMGRGQMWSPLRPLHLQLTRREETLPQAAPGRPSSRQVGHCCCAGEHHAIPALLVSLQLCVLSLGLIPPQAGAFRSPNLRQSATCKSLSRLHGAEALGGIQQKLSTGGNQRRAPSGQQHPGTHCCWRAGLAVGVFEAVKAGCSAEVLQSSPWLQVREPLGSMVEGLSFTLLQPWHTSEIPGLARQQFPRSCHTCRPEHCWHACRGRRVHCFPRSGAPDVLCTPDHPGSLHGAVHVRTAWTCCPCLKLCWLQAALHAWQGALLGSLPEGASTAQFEAGLPESAAQLAMLWQRHRMGHTPRRYSAGVLADLRSVPVPTSAGQVLRLGASR